MKLRKIFLAAVLLLAVALPSGCGKKLKPAEVSPSPAAATEAASIMPTEQTAEPAADNVVQPDISAQDPVNVPGAGSPAQTDNSGSGAASVGTPAISRADAERIVTEATGATSLKTVAEGQAYVFDCYQGENYMGTVEVNANTGELTYQ